MRDVRRRTITALLAITLMTPLALPAAAAAQSGGAYVDGAEPWTESDCAGDVPIVVGSDAAAQSDIYSAVTLAGVVGTDCVILAGARDGDMPVSQRARLNAAAAGGYIVGGASAVPAVKTAGRSMSRLAGADRWATAQLVGSEARSLSGGSTPAAPAPDTSLTAPGDVRQPGVYLRGAEPWIASDCSGDVPIVVGSDAKAQSDIYSAVTLAGVVGTDCVILVGPRDGDMPASQQARLDDADEGGYVAGGIAAVPTAKIAGRDMTRFAGADRWATAQLVGRHASGDTTAGTSTADEPTADAGTPASTTDSYAAVSAGGAHTCALRNDGAITCWGDNRRLQADAPSGTFIAVSAGGAFTCALRNDRTITCWGDSRYGRTEAPSGTFNALSAGPNATCGLRTSGAVTCWGESSYSGVEVSGTFTAVSAGAVYACGLRDNGTIACWGRPRRGRADNPPSGTFNALSVDNGHRCGLRSDSTITCWGPFSDGSPYSERFPDPPSGTFSAVAAGTFHACGLRDNGTITCWGDDRFGPADAPSGKFTAVSAGGLHVCGLRGDGTIACWGPNGIGQTDAPPSPLADGATTSAAQGRILKTGFFACGVLGDGTTDCRWSGPSLSGIGDLILGVPATPQGDYISLVSQPDVDDRFMCLLRSDGEVRCWAPARQWFAPPSGTYETLHPAHDGGICGLRTDDTVACWDVSGTWATPPSGAIRSLHQTDRRGICAMHADRSVTCWDRRTTWGTPSGQFAYLGPSAPGGTVGWRYSNCGLRTDRTVECWEVHPDWSGPPSGTFASLHHDSGGGQYCGLRPDGTAACWGSFQNPFEAPSGQFASLRVFDNGVACGLRPNGMVACWGGTAEKTWTPTHPVEFASLVPLYNSMCGLRSDGTAVCWHSDVTWPATPDGRFAYLVQYSSFSVCGSRVDGRFVCWDFDEVLPTVRDSFTSVQLGNGFASWCGFTSDGTVTCSFDAQRRNTPRGAFTSLIVGHTHHLWCGLRTNGTVACWSYFGIWGWGDSRPEGKFTSLHTVDNTICALRADRSIACWDDAYDTAQYHNRYRIPDGPLAAVAIDATGSFGCVLSKAGRLHCWDAI